MYSTILAKPFHCVLIMYQTVMVKTEQEKQPAKRHLSLQEEKTESWTECHNIMGDLKEREEVGGGGREDDS